jgi:cytochrome c oxidase subunit 3
LDLFARFVQFVSSEQIVMAAAANIISAPTAAWSETLPRRGRVGILALILTESAFFSIFVVAYIFYLGKSITGPFPRDVLSTPILNTVCLLSSSITIVLAIRSLRAGAIRTFTIWWFATFALGFEFLVGTAFEWHKLIYRYGLTIRTNLFGTTYYALVGLHALHVTVGLLLILLVMVLTMCGYMSDRHVERTDVLSWYWHFVDAVWVVVFLTVYVVGH